jgi:hypothetical protein
MSERTLKTLLVVLSAVLVLWLGVSVFSGGGGSAGTPENVATLFDGLTREVVSEVRIATPGDGEAIELQREEGSWTANGFATDSGTVARFWDALGEARMGDRMASNPSNHPRMGVSADSAIRLEILSGNDSRVLLVGKNGPRYGTAFARLPEEDQVHLLEGNLRSQLTRTLDDWRDKRIIALDTVGIGRVEVERDGEAYALERGDSLWSLSTGEEADPTVINGILAELASLVATGFYSPSDSLSEPGGTLRALGITGDTLLQMELGSGEGDRWVRVLGDPILYRLPSWRVTRVAPDRDRVRPGS